MQSECLIRWYKLARHICELQVMRYFLSCFETRSRSQEQLCLAIRYIILPLLDHAFQHTPPEPVLDAAMLHSMVVHMFDPPEDQAGM